MRRIALRLVVALLTFVVGVTASSLFNFNSSHKSERCVAPAPAAVLVASPSVEPASPQAQPSGCWDPKIVVFGGILQGKATSRPLPVYPPIAKAARAQGNVVVQILVDENGNVACAQALSGHPLLRQATIEAAWQAKFTPTRLNGVPVKVAGTLTYNFVPE